MYGLILSNGGITNSSMNRMAKLYDCTTSQNLLGKLNKMASRYAVDLDTWDEFGIVVDNVDIFVKPRREMSTKTNQMFHMVQAIAVEERVQASILDNAPAISVDKIQPDDVLPSETDKSRVRNLMCSKVIQIWSTMPALKDIDVAPPQEHHQYSEHMSKRSNQVRIQNQINLFIIH